MFGGGICKKKARKRARTMDEETGARGADHER